MLLMETEDLLPCSQGSATGPFSEPDVFPCLGRSKESVQIRGPV